MTDYEIYWCWIPESEIPPPEVIEAEGICSVEKVQDIVLKIEDFLENRCGEYVPVYAYFSDRDEKMGCVAVDFKIDDNDITSEDLLTELKNDELLEYLKIDIEQLIEAEDDE